MISVKPQRRLNLPIETGRLTLRDFMTSDFDAIFAYSSNPRVTKYLFFGPRDSDSTADYLQGLIASQVESPRLRFELAVQERASGRVIGACDLSFIEGNAVDLGYMLGLPDWGKGYATEGAAASIDWAIDHLGWDEVVHCIDAANVPSQAVAKRLGSAILRKTRLPAPYEDSQVDVWGQSATAWRSRRHAF